MAYQDLALRNIAGEVSVTYNDNNLRNQQVPDPVSGARMLATATAKRGANAEVYDVANLARAMNDFDSRSELSTLISSARNSNPQVPMSVARIGAKPFHFIIKRAIEESHEMESLIRITPVFVQESDSARNIESSLESYRLILLPHVEGSLIRQRVIIVASDQTDRNFSIVYDSERKLQINGDSAFDIEIDIPLGDVLVTPNAYEATTVELVNQSVTLAQLQVLSDLSAFKFADLPKLSDLESAVLSKIKLVGVADRSLTDLNDASLEPAFSVKQIIGSAGEYIDHVERYAANELVYEKLEFENFQFLFCEKCYADLNPVNLDSLDGKYEQLNWHKESLGYMWKYIYNGRPYVFMFGRKNPFDSTKVGSYSFNVGDGTIAAALSADQEKLGDFLNLVEFNVHCNGGVTTNVESFVNEKGLVECHIDVDVTTSSQTIKTPFGDLTLSANVVADTESFSFRNRVSAINGTRTCSDHLLASSYNLDPFAMTHFDLTGEFVPEGVMSRLLTFDENLDGNTDSYATLVAKEIEVRETSFLQQAAQSAYVASTNYNQVVAIVPTTPPPASINGISRWAGNPGDYQVTASGEIIIKTNGTGVLGTRLLAGATDYRDGAAFGGVILTNGNNLPNKLPYGVDDTDEALDSSGNPIDLGKHAVVVGAYGLVPKAEAIFPGNSRKPRTGIQASVFGSAGPMIAARLNSLAPGTEPIGPVLGQLPGFVPQQRTPRKVLNDLAALRICMIDQTGVISSIYTSALRTSDYSKISSILSANAIVSQVKYLCNPVIGQPFNDAQIASLRQRIDGAMRIMIQSNYAQDISVSMFASQLDRINGVLNCSIRFVPPLSLEAINISLTLEAPSA